MQKTYFIFTKTFGARVDWVAVLCLHYAMLLFACEEQRQRNIAKETATPSRARVPKWLLLLWCRSHVYNIYHFPLKTSVCLCFNILGSCQQLCLVGWLKCSVMVNIFIAHPRMCGNISLPTLEHVLHFSTLTPIAWSCHSIDMHIWGIITQNVSCPPRSDLQIFYVLKNYSWPLLFPPPPPRPQP